MSWADKCNNTLDFRSNCSEEKTEKKGPDLDLDLWSKMSIQIQIESSCTQVE